MRKVELMSWDELPKRVDSIKRSLEIIYGVRLEADLEDVPLDRLHPTEDFLENDKLAAVFMKVTTEQYNVPIIVVKRADDYFVLDGHHRSYISKKLMLEAIKAYVLKFPKGNNYRNLPKRSIEDLTIKEISTIDDPILKAWEQTLIVLKYYEALYDIHFHLTKEQVCLKDLVPTQSETGKKQIDAIKELLVPITCIKHENKYYILDGHARSLRAKQLGLNSIQATILSPEKPIDFGIVKTAKEMKLASLEDTKITE